MPDDHPRTAFAAAHPDVLLLDPADPAAIERYTLAAALVARAELPLTVERAGAGNMNLTLRVRLGSGSSLILKQGYPWVVKYQHIAAPWERTLVEGAFYELVRPQLGSIALPETVRSAGGPASIGMPALLHLDAGNRILALEDLGADGDCSAVYQGGMLRDGEAEAMLIWLEALGQVDVPDDRRALFANRAMRELNHEHIFRLPLAEANGLDLDAITPGLQAAADELKRDRDYTRCAASLGAIYLADGERLVHGDYFPGSWIRTPTALRVIDPEFCFCGAPEFDYGVMLGHAALALGSRSIADRILAAVERRGLNLPLTLQLAGIEIMRRLVGVAQLQLAYGLEEKQLLLALSRRLVLTPEKGL